MGRRASGCGCAPAPRPCTSGSGSAPPVRSMREGMGLSATLRTHGRWLRRLRTAVRLRLPWSRCGGPGGGGGGRSGCC